MGPERPAMLRASLAAWPGVCGARRGRQGRGPALSVVLKPRPRRRTRPGPGTWPGGGRGPRRSSRALRKGSGFSRLLSARRRLFRCLPGKAIADGGGRSLRPGGGSAGSRKKGVLGGCSSAGPAYETRKRAAHGAVEGC